MNNRMQANQRIRRCTSSLLLSLAIALPSMASAQTAATDLPARVERPTTAPTDAVAAGRQGKTGNAKRIASDTAVSNGTPVGKGRWVARIDYSHCPGGTTAYVAGDGGVKCWAGPD